MSDHSPLLTRPRWYMLLALVLLLACGYLLTYAGDIESGDTLALFDLTASQARFGDNRLALSAWFWQPDTQAQNGLYPLQTSDVEPLQTALALGLYWLADHLPGIG
ncbi:MAG: hypothetical protein K8I60_01290, partial [Anaerolineae bacterium]|nr:hypothetical protein [Anaerolineae bacterium]